MYQLCCYLIPGATVLKLNLAHGKILLYQLVFWYLVELLRERAGRAMCQKPKGRLNHANLSLPAVLS